MSCTGPGSIIAHAWESTWRRRALEITKAQGCHLANEMQKNRLTRTGSEFLLIHSDCAMQEHGTGAVRRHSWALHKDKSEKNLPRAKGTNFSSNSFASTGNHINHISTGRTLGHEHFIDNLQRVWPLRCSFSKRNETRKKFLIKTTSAASGHTTSTSRRKH